MQRNRVGIDEIFPMECLIQRQQLKFLWKIVHLEDTAIQKIVLFGKISSQYIGRKGGRKQTYVSCLKLALANFGVSMKECIEMAELDWEYYINNQALLETTAKWRARPSALKTINNFWAPTMQARGKRKKILVDDDEDGETEDVLLSSTVASRGMTNSEDDSRTIEKAEGEISDTIIYRRGRRQHSFKRLRTVKPMLHVFTEQCTQDFSPTENNVTGEETCSHQKNVENVEERGDQVRTANERANNFAADVLLARLEERFNMDGVAQMSEVVHVGQSMNVANVGEKVNTENNMRKDRRHEKNNTRHRRKIAAQRNKRSLQLPKSSDAIFVEPLRLIMGRDRDLIQDNIHLHDQHIAWEHRTSLGQATRPVNNKCEH